MKKNEALKPPPLPQNPVIAKEKSDAEDEGLKGKVKQVTEELEESSGNRKLSDVMSFDERGNFLERDYFDSRGNVDSINMYGYIDGKRVVKSKYISHDYDPPAPPPLKKTETGDPVKKADTRYDYSFQYKYANGKLTERQLISNTDELVTRYVYNHSNDKIEKLVYSKNGDLNQKFSVALDKNGNVIEEVFFGLKNADIYGDSKYFYTYEFDGRGNWIKKTATGELIRNGKVSAIPKYVKYRTIIYY
ncbi:MAG TPA: hypothetical protein VF644_18990 [Pyrinomonadaceae bacterium]